MCSFPPHCRALWLVPPPTPLSCSPFLCPVMQGTPFPRSSWIQPTGAAGGREHREEGRRGISLFCLPYSVSWEAPTGSLPGSSDASPILRCCLLLAASLFPNLVSKLPFSIRLCSNTHNIKFAILTMFNHQVQSWLRGHGQNFLLPKLNLCPH